MPQNKNQHYVPRCHLKPFSLNNEGLAINLYNLSSSLAVPNAPLKNQCSKHYFYGDQDDLRLEKGLQIIERDYARIIHTLQNNASSLTKADLLILREFTFLQHFRTEEAAKRLGMMYESMHKATYEGRPVEPEDLDVSERRMILSSMRHYVSTRPYTEDLKVCIIENSSSEDFITSDDPAIFTNRFYSQKQKEQSFGIASSGVLLILPLTPKFLFLCYDGNLYSVPKKNEVFAVAKKKKDILAFNELQYLKASKNIYYSDWGKTTKIDIEAKRYIDKRPEAWHRITIFVTDEEHERGERYRLATEEEKQTATKTLMMLSSDYPKPSVWPSIVPFRHKLIAYQNGTAAGYLRKKEWLEGRDLL